MRPGRLPAFARGTRATARPRRSFRGLFGSGGGQAYQQNRTHARDDVERDRYELRIPQPPRRHQREVGQETSDRGPRGVHGVQQRDAPSLRFDVAANEMPNEQRQRATHEQADRYQQRDRYSGTCRMRCGSDDVPAVRVLLVRGDENRDAVEVREDERNRETHRRNRDLEVTVRAQRRVGVRGIPPVRPRARKVAARAQPQHEDCDHDRCGIHGVAEDVAEDADPDDLVNQSAEAGAEEEEIQHELPISKSQGGPEGPRRT